MQCTYEIMSTLISFRLDWFKCFTELFMRTSVMLQTGHTDTDWERGPKAGRSCALSCTPDAPHLQRSRQPDGPWNLHLLRLRGEPWRPVSHLEVWRIQYYIQISDGKSNSGTIHTTRTDQIRIPIFFKSLLLLYFTFIHDTKVCAKN